MNEALINNLKYLGFNVYEAKIYIEMLKQSHPLTAYEIAGISVVPRSKVYEVVDKLFVKHVLVRTENSPKKYLAVDHDVILKTIGSEFDSSIDYVKNEFSKFSTGETVEHIFNLIGKESVIKKSKEMIKSASESILLAAGLNLFSELEGCLHKAEDRGGGPPHFPKCGSEMAVPAIITNPEEVHKILTHLRKNKSPPFDNKTQPEAS